MSTSLLYTQCTLRKATANGCLEDVAWIPAHLAHKGTRLRVKSDGQWDDGWMVTETGLTRSGEDLALQEQVQREFAQVLAE